MYDYSLSFQAVVKKTYVNFHVTGSNLAVLDGGITPLPLATVPQLPRFHEESMRFDFAIFLVFEILDSFKRPIFICKTKRFIIDLKSVC